MTPATKDRLLVLAIIVVGFLGAMWTVNDAIGATPRVGTTASTFHIAPSDTSCYSTRAALVCYHRGTGRWARVARNGDITINRAPVSALRRPHARLVTTWSRHRFYCIIRAGLSLCIAPGDSRPGGLVIAPDGMKAVR